MGSGSGSSQLPPGRRSASYGRSDRGRPEESSSSSGAAVRVTETGLHLRPLVSHSISISGHLVLSGNWCRSGIGNESDQVDRAISTGKLHALPHFHTRPINVVVFHGSSGRNRFEGGFPLRCLQRLSRPDIATLHCGWRHNRSTRDPSIPVLSY